MRVVRKTRMFQYLSRMYFTLSHRTASAYLKQCRGMTASSKVKIVNGVYLISVYRSRAISPKFRRWYLRTTYVFNATRCNCCPEAANTTSSTFKIIQQKGNFVVNTTSRPGGNWPRHLEISEYVNLCLGRSSR